MAKRRNMKYDFERRKTEKNLSNMKDHKTITSFAHKKCNDKKIPPHQTQDKKKIFYFNMI